MIMPAGAPKLTSIFDELILRNLSAELLMCRF